MMHMCMMHTSVIFNPWLCCMCVWCGWNFVTNQPTNEQGDFRSRIITATLTILLMTTLRSAPSSIRSPTSDTISVSAQEGQSAFTSTPDQTIKKDFWGMIVILDTLVECTSWNPILDTTQQHRFKTNKHCFRYYDIFTFCNPYNLSRESFYSGSWRLFFDTNCQKRICWTYLVNWTTPCFETK